jgi:predicted small lipoprotein YifL
MKLIAAMLVVLAITACGGKGSGDSDKAAARTDTLNERQRDTMLSRSRIPGARGVGKAMRVADSTSAGVEQTNAVARDTTPF